MTMPTLANTELRAEHHARCFVCDPHRSGGLALRCGLNEEGVALACFDCTPAHEGYAGLLHGGVTAALLDGIMTNCLFLHGRVALTADLRVRYRRTVVLHEQAVLRGWIVEQREPLFRMRAELSQGGIVKATAQATFFERGDA